MADSMTIVHAQRMSENDTDLAIFRFDEVDWRLRGWKHVESFAAELEAFWRPFEREEIQDPANVRGNVLVRINQIQNEISNAKSRGETPEHFGRTLLNLLDQQYGPFHPEGKNGSVVAGIEEAVGHEAAAFAYAVMRRLSAISEARTLDQLRGAMMAAFPTIVDSVSAEERLAAERATFRAATRRLSEEMTKAEAQRQEHWDGLLARASVGFLKTIKRRSRAWRSALKRWKTNNSAAISSIEATENAYKELMALKAPVDYWTAKAAKHRENEGAAALRVVVFFITSVPLMAAMFGGTAYYLLKNSVPNPPAGLYIIAGAGLATTAGLLFWIGRLFTKLYLSQHHLRHDAEERAVMTTTYLALTADQAAGETDRQIILNALFRNTSDGIVKEEGGLDPNIASVLSKIAMR